MGATNYICFLLSHGYIHGLASFLKQKHWSLNGVQASYERPGKGFAFLAVEIDLSYEGVDRVDDVIFCVFQYLQLIRTSGPQKRIWDEIKLLNDIDFCYHAENVDSESFVDSLAAAMSKFPVRDILVSTYSVIDDYQPEEISKLLDFLIPTNMRVIVTAKSNADISNKADEWCGAKYKYSKIDNALIQKWKMCGLNPALQLPEPNPLLPNTFELKARDPKGGKFPRLIEENSRSEVWFLQDNQYKLPQANMHLHIVSSKLHESESSVNLSTLFVISFLDSISEYRANALRAGLTCNLDFWMFGFLLSVEGYDCKCGDIFEYVVKKLLGYRSVKERFEDVRQGFIREREAMIDARGPGGEADDYLIELLLTFCWSEKTVLRDMYNNAYTAHDVDEFIRYALSSVKLKWLFVGNLTEEEALRTYYKCSADFDEIGAKPMTSSEWYRIRQFKRQAILPAGTINIYPKVQNTHRNSVTLLALQCGASGHRDSTLFDLLSNIISEPMYDIVGTQEQLDVQYYPWSYLGANILYFIVAGEREPSYLDERMENFLTDFCKTIDRMDEDVFRESVESLTVNTKRRLTLSGPSLFDEILFETYIFDKSERTLKHLQSITLKELQEYFHEWISPYAPKRKKLSIQIKSQLKDPDLIDQGSHRPPTTPSTSTIQATSGTKSISHKETRDINEASNTEKPNIQARISNGRKSTRSSIGSSTGKRFSPYPVFYTPRSSTNSTKAKFLYTVTQQSQSRRQPMQDDVVLEHEQDRAGEASNDGNKDDYEENDDASSINDYRDDAQSLPVPEHVSTPNSLPQTTSSNESGPRLKSKETANQTETNTSNSNGNQTEVTGYLELDDTFSETSDDQSIAGSSNKSTSTKKKKKKQKSLHRRKRTLH